MPAITKSAVLEALRAVIDPDLHKDIVSLGFVKDEDVLIEGDKVAVRVWLTTPACPVKEKMQAECERLVRALPGVKEVHVTMDARTMTGRDSSEGTKERLASVKNVIAVGSGKGGVGKSTVAANLAYALRQTGAKVGLLDADIYGPSVPILLGIQGTQLTMNDEQKIVPIEKYGMKAVSMGLLMKDSDAVVWRGPMLGKALQQFIDDVAWGELDYLVIDLPPGTGDVQLSLTQLIPLDGAVIVTTPQDVAFADVRRAIKMFEMTRVPMLGLVENMSFFLCPDNGKAYHVFGAGRTAAHAAEHNLEVLGSLPLDMQVGPAADRGELIAIADPGGNQARVYSEIAGRVASELSKRHAAKERKSSLKGFFSVKPS